MLTSETMSETELNRWYRHMSELGYRLLKELTDFDVDFETEHHEILTKVNPRKQKDIDNLINCLDEHKSELQKTTVILFGSSTNGLCHDTSDIDIACSIDADSEKEYNRIYNTVSRILLYSLNSEYDLISIEHLFPQSELYSTIKNEGVVLWNSK